MIQSAVSVLVFIKDLLIATFSQMASLFGGILIFGLILHFVSSLTFKSLENSFGRKGAYAVAWLGVPVHELGHALFCLVFFHRIEELKLFEPDPVTGTLGYVLHTWSRRNPWQVLGNLFIGIGPVITGCAALVAVFYFLVPDGQQAWQSILSGVGGVYAGYSLGSYLAVLQSSTFSMVQAIFTGSNLSGWGFWVFCYLSICIASNIRLSVSDIRGTLPGLGWAVLPFLAYNAWKLATGAGGENIPPFLAPVLGTVYSVLVLALVMVALGFAVIYAISAIYFWLRYRRPLNPFA
jgi:hypothetical protein